MPGNVPTATGCCPCALFKIQLTALTAFITAGVNFGSVNAGIWKISPSFSTKTKAIYCCAYYAQSAGEATPSPRRGPHKPTRQAWRPPPSLKTKERTLHTSRTNHQTPRRLHLQLKKRSKPVRVYPVCSPRGEVFKTPPLSFNPVATPLPAVTYPLAERVGLGRVSHPSTPQALCVDPETFDAE